MKASESPGVQEMSLSKKLAPKPSSEVHGAMRAMRRAAERAKETALRTGTPLVIVDSPSGLLEPDTPAVKP
jgi:hypothetical protein